MQNPEAVTALAALAHPHRLSVFRLLVERGPAGYAAGELAERIGIPSSSLAFHTQHLRQAGLLSRRRFGRRLTYAADFAAMNDLIGYLTENCCAESVVDCAGADRSTRTGR